MREASVCRMATDTDSCAFILFPNLEVYREAKHYIMQRFLLFLILTAYIPIHAIAKGSELLVIEDTCGDNYVVQLDDDPEIFFDDGNLVVVANDESVLFPLATLKSYGFAQSGTVDEVLNENSRLYMEKKGDLITLKNLPENLLIQVVNINGILIDKFKVPAERALSFSIENYQNGIYFLHAGKLTAKFIK